MWNETENDDTETAGEGPKQYERRHGSLKKEEAHDYIMCNWSQEELTQTGKKWKIYTEVKARWCTGCVLVQIWQESEAKEVEAYSVNLEGEMLVQTTFFSC